MSNPSAPLLCERIEETLCTLVHRIATTHNAAERELLLRDFAWKASQAPPPVKGAMTELLVDTLSGRTPPEAIHLPVLTATTGARQVDVAFIAVQPVERRALLHAFSTPPVTRSIEGREYYEVTFGEDREIGAATAVLTASMSAYNAPTVKAITEIAREYHPRLWVMVGMCAGVKGVMQMGDVVLPTLCWDYEPGRNVPTGFEPRPQILERPKRLSDELWNFEAAHFLTPDRLYRSAGGVDKSDLPRDWEDARREVSVRNHVVASGEKLLRDGETMNKLHSFNENIRIADQESYGFALACSSAPWLVARGVSDYGTPEKSDEWQFMATRLAIEVAKAFVEYSLLREEPVF